MTVRELLEITNRFHTEVIINTPCTIEEYPDPSRVLDIYGDCDVWRWSLHGINEDSVRFVIYLN